MKTLVTLLAALQVATCIPHDPVPVPAKQTNSTTSITAPASTLAGPLPPSSAAGSPAPSPSGAIAPEGCKRLSTDRDWPTEAQWTAAIPGVLKRDANLPEGIARPDYHFSAKTVADVQKAVKFVAQNNIRLTIINSGHDFLGRNDAPSGLSLDVSQLRGIRVLNSFTPTAQGAQTLAAGSEANVLPPVAGKQPAVTFGAGWSTQELNNAISPSKLFTMGAAHGEVKPAGGWGQTGGHGPLTPQYGLGVDQFLELKVVTPDGQLRVANKVANSDLFWALRGGGGSTFGVVVEATVKAYPDHPITVFNWWVNSTEENSQGLWDAYGYLHTQFPDVVNKGVAGYYYWYKNALKGIMGHPGKIASNDQAQAVWKPVLDKLQSFPTMTKWQAKSVTYPNFKEYFDARFGAIEEGMEGMEGMDMRKRHGPESDPLIPMPMGATSLDSRLLGAEHFKNPNLTAALKAADPSKTGYLFGLLGHLTAGGKVMKPDDETSVVPAWRKAYVHIVGLKIEGQSNVDSLRKLAPDMGAYANEANPQEENWKQSFWGSNYARLSQIKTKYDPNNVLWTTPGINADTMQVTNGRLCKFIGPLTAVLPPKNDNQNPRDSSVAGEGTGNDSDFDAFPGTPEAARADAGKLTAQSYSGV